MAKKSDRKRLVLTKIENDHPVTRSLGEALEGRADGDGAWNEQYATPTKKKKSADKRYPKPTRG